MSHSNWQFFLADSVTMTPLVDISRECTQKSFTLSLNRPGTFNFTIPMFSRGAEFTESSKYCVIAQKNDIPVWSGALWTKTERFASEKIELSAVGWFQYLMKRFITDSSHTYSTINQGDVAFSLLALANAQLIDGVARPTWITAGSNTSTTIYTSKKFERWQNIGQEITNLTDVEAGFDFVIDPVTREMNISNWDEYLDNTDAHFAFNYGPNNVTDVTRTTSADDMANQNFVTGGNSTTVESHDTNTTHQIEYGIHQKTINVNEISDNGILGAISNAETAINSLPRVLLNFDPHAEGATQSVPRLFENYNLGDQVYLTAKRDGQEILNQAIRLFGLTMNIDENGNEKVSSLQTTSQTGGG
jgi:hypothetical protein